MITFERDTNKVKIDFGGEVEFVSPETTVRGKAGTTLVQIASSLKIGNRINYELNTLDITGRPSDDGAAVAEWLSDTYFFGQNYPSGGGGGPVDYSTSGRQDTQIARADTQIANQTTMINQDAAYYNRAPSSDITVAYDTLDLVRNVDGRLDEVVYYTGGLGGTEVARKTLTYDGNGDLESVVTT